MRFVVIITSGTSKWGSRLPVWSLSLMRRWIVSWIRDQQILSGSREQMRKWCVTSLTMAHFPFSSTASLHHGVAVSFEAGRSKADHVPPKLAVMTEDPGPNQSGIMWKSSCRGPNQSVVNVKVVMQRTQPVSCQCKSRHDRGSHKPTGKIDYEW